MNLRSQERWPLQVFLGWFGKLETWAASLFGIVLAVVAFRTLGIVTLTITIFPTWLKGTWLLWLMVVLFTTLALTLIVRPIRKFQKYAQKRRIEQIDSFYSPDIVAEYFNRFWAGRDGFGELVNSYKQSGGEAKKNAGDRLKLKFNEVLRDIFGLDRITGATLLMGTAAAIVLFIAVEGGVMWAVEIGPGKGSQHYLFGIKPDAASIAAIFGAYTWVASDVIYRYRLADLSTSDINWYTLRFIVAIPLGVALAQFAGYKAADVNSSVSNTGPILAFVVSMFSLSRIQEVLGALVNRGTGVSLAAVNSPDANDITVKLPGIDQRISDRLASEGVTTIAQIATCDPVRLSSRANIPFNLMVEFIDAAILWQLVGSKLLLLREFGWIGASHVLGFGERSAQDFDQLLKAYAVAEGEYTTAKQAAEAVAPELLAAQTRLQNARDAMGAAMPPTPLQAKEISDAATLVDQLIVAERTAENAKKRLDDAQMAVAQRPRETIFERIGAAASMEPLAVEEIVWVISRNEYARFIREIMKVGATSCARSETTQGKSAVPK